MLQYCPGFIGPLGVPEIIMILIMLGVPAIIIGAVVFMFIRSEK